MTSAGATGAGVGVGSAGSSDGVWDAVAVGSGVAVGSVVAVGSCVAVGSYVGDTSGPSPSAIAGMARP